MCQRSDVIKKNTIVSTTMTHGFKVGRGLYEDTEQECAFSDTEQYFLIFRKGS